MPAAMNVARRHSRSRGKIMRDQSQSRVCACALFGLRRCRRVVAAPRAEARALTKGAANYKPYAVEHIGKALAGAKELQAAVKAGDAKAAQAAWIKSRKGWEAIEPITGEFFRQARRSDRRLAGRQAGLSRDRGGAVCRQARRDSAQPVDGLVANLDRIRKAAERARASSSRRRACSTAPPSSPTRSARTNRRAASRHMPAPRSSTCRRTSKASRRSTSWCSRTPEEERRQARQAHQRQDRGCRGAGEGQRPQELDQPALQQGGRGTGGAAAERGAQAQAQEAGSRRVEAMPGRVAIAASASVWPLPRACVAGDCARRRPGAGDADHQQGRRAAARHRTERGTARSAERAVLFRTRRRQALLSAQSRRHAVLLAGDLRRRGARRPA